MNYDDILFESGDGSYVLYLEDLADFVEVLLDDYVNDGRMEGTPEEYDGLINHWITYFDKETALILDYMSIVEIMKEYEQHMLSKALRSLVKEGRVEVLWCEDKNDFVFKASSQFHLPYWKSSDLLLHDVAF